MRQKVTFFLMLLLATNLAPSLAQARGYHAHLHRHSRWHHHHRAAADTVEEAGAVAGGTSGGLASWYGGRGGGLTAAHRFLPFGTRVLVTNRSNGRSVVVRINDRGPFVRGRVIDLSRQSAEVIGVTGVSPVTLRRL